MEAWTHNAIMWFLHLLALPEVGLSAIFIISLVSATLLPLGSEPVVLAYLTVSPSMFWPAIFIATVGNTIGGTISYWMGLGAAKAHDKWRDSRSTAKEPEDFGKKTAGRWHKTIMKWIGKMGPKALLLSWVPGLGDPLCAVAGWLRLPLGPSIVYMAIGKFLRYTLMTAGILWVLPHLGIHL